MSRLLAKKERNNQIRELKNSSTDIIKMANFCMIIVHSLKISDKIRWKMVTWSLIAVLFTISILFFNMSAAAVAAIWKGSLIPFRFHHLIVCAVFVAAVFYFQNLWFMVLGELYFFVSMVLFMRVHKNGVLFNNLLLTSFINPLRKIWL